MTAPTDPDEDDLVGFQPASRRFVARFGRVLAAVLALLLVVPAGRWAVDELRFRGSGDQVRTALGDDAELARSMLMVQAVGCTGTPVSGSAFAVDPGAGSVVVTNRHVVEDAASVGVRPLLGGPVLAVGSVEVATTADVAVLHLAEPADVPPPLPAGEPVAAGAEVRVVGFPGATPFTATGAVLAAEPGRLLLDVPTDRGTSGSPVLDADGRVVGQVHARTTAGAGIATPVDRLVEAVAAAVPAPDC